MSFEMPTAGFVREMLFRVGSLRYQATQLSHVSTIELEGVESADP